MRTKFQKQQTTYLLDIPDLLEVVKEWDKEIRAVLPDNSFWFAPISPDTGEIGATITSVGSSRHSRARRDLEEWLKRVGLPYHSPHKFRHSHAVYALKNAKDISALKAVSQNLMHANLNITDGVYGVLSGTDVKGEISELDKESESTDVRELKSLVELLLLKLTEKPT